MATVQRFEDLEVWKLSRILEKKFFEMTKPVNFHNDFDLINQMRRSSGSIMDNIAEGFGRSSRLEFINSLSIAKGEETELKSQLYRANDRQYIVPAQLEELQQETELLLKKLGSFISYLNETEIKGQKFMNR